MARGRILAIDDDAGSREFLKVYFEDRDFDVDIAEDGEQGLAQFKKGAYDLVLCDMLMPRMTGIQALKMMKEIKPDQKVIMMTGAKEESLKAKAQALGCFWYILKPLKLQDLEMHVRECFPD